MFSVREALVVEDGLAGRMLRAFLLAQRFLNTHSAADVVDRALERRENRRAVLDALGGGLHVAFMAPNEAGALDAIAAAARDAGFDGEHVRFASTAIALELGSLVGRPLVPTAILKAHRLDDGARDHYVETFVPEESRVTIDGWIRAEIGTHVGLRLTARDAMPAVVDAFVAEGYGVPEFMRGRPITNPSEASIVTYVDTIRHGTRLRIELFTDAEERA